ncbi:MAG TPA: response regulator transcription factor [Methylibium sp.]|uniref:winged helix-turn-helix transcriptional regulator n=1 Tax=Methylibium sp. TaxID=2067992 RepID=UPI002DBA6F03|nr:response regulator transcription factor [Methylibium sp.]HEU4459585.1 response regulator transcription factor [Methylibium sp.]
MNIACLTSTQTAATAIGAHLALAGMDVRHCDDLNALLHAVRQGFLHAVVVEPAEEQIDDWLAILCERLPREVPVVVVSMQMDARTAARAFAGGACDYLPLAQVADLPLRLTAHCAARRLRQSNVLELGGFVLRRDTMSVRRDGVDVLLTPREFALAWALFSSAGNVVSLSRIAAQVWGRDIDISKRTIEQHMYKLRTKLGIGNRPGSRIQAVYGVGYRLEIDEHCGVAAPAGLTARRRADASAYSRPA